jgi:uroporphyrinogen-III synthase
MVRVLSTKTLKPSQKTLLHHAGIGLVEYDAISINFLDFTIPPGFEYLIFSSKNGVRAFMEQATKNGLTFQEQNIACYCVGKKTRDLLEANGFKVLHSAETAKELALYIAKEHRKNPILFICGNQRRDELPTLLKEQNVALTEVVAYETRLNPVKHPGNFDGILFFSPSGVESFFSGNTAGQATAYCIGRTTAAAVSAYTERYRNAPEPVVESLVQLVISELGS